MAIIEINNLEERGTAVYSSMTEHELRKEGDNHGLFIAESPKVIITALDSGYEAISLLCERKHIEGDAKTIIERLQNLPVYTGSRELLASLTGYKLTRGVLCAMKRRPLQEGKKICEQGKRIAVIESVCDTTNIGSIFRSAAALGIDGILLTPDSCDPFNRRSIRVSMGSVFRVPWTFVKDPICLLREHGFITVALTLEKDSIRIDCEKLRDREKLAVVLGTEGDGLSQGIIEKCDYKAIIPMHHNVDSLNVGSAAAVAFWEITRGINLDGNKEIFK